VKFAISNLSSFTVIVDNKTVYISRLIKDALSIHLFLTFLSFAIVIIMHVMYLGKEANQTISDYRAAFK